MTSPKKFRGWHTGQKRMYTAEEMARDQLTLLPTGCFINVHGAHTSLSTIYPSDKFIPLQFIGLTDKNGQEIYEGDIISLIAGTKEVFTAPVIYNTDKSCFDLLHPAGYHGHWGMSRDIIDACEYTIIGNIYENPELLK